MTNKTLVQLYAEHVGKVSSKWSIYLTEYGRIFDEHRDRPVRLLEIGIQNGGSLEIWSKYFPHAQKLVGCDINPDCARLSYEDPRIAVVVGDANSDTAQAKVLGYAPAFDVIIDDGSHRSSDIVRSFARYFPHLADGGVFVAEDLHCSYWQEFEGGLFDPFSSITFFKRLADVVSHEHWGIEKARADILSGFFAKYGSQIDEEALQHVHSVEFINSMCVIRKDKPVRNRLGTLITVGLVGIIVSRQVLHSSLGPAPDQTSNEWTARSVPPDEELLLRIKELADRDDQIASLNQAVAERDGQIASLAVKTPRTPVRDQRLAYVNYSRFRNDIEVFAFDPASGAFGAGGARIECAGLASEDGMPLSWIVGGEVVVFWVHVRASRDIANPIVGFFVKDRLGQTLFGDNTYLTYARNPQAVTSGEVLEARFLFQIPILPAGEYSIAVAVAEGTQEKHVQHHWIHDALLFRSHSTSVCTGLVGIPMLDIQLTRSESHQC